MTGSGGSPLYLVLIVFGGAFFDSLGSRNQTGIKEKFKPGPYQFMFFTCFWVSIFSFTIGKIFVAYLLGQVLGENQRMIGLFRSHPESLIDQLKLSGLNVFGQIFIFTTLSWMGPIILALITTTRKIFSVLASIVYYGHSVDVWKGSGIATVVVGLVLEMSYSILKKDEKPKSETSK